MATIDKLTAIYGTHSAYLERLAVGLGNDAQPYIDKIQSKVESLLNSMPKTSISDNKMKSIQDAIDEITREQLQEYSKYLKAEHKNLGEYEAGYTGKTINSVIETKGFESVVPSKSQVAQLAIGSPLKLGEGSFTTYTKMLKDYWSNNAERLNSIVLNGFVNGQTNKQKADLILDELGGWSKRAKRNALSIARTGANHYATQAHIAFADDNDDVLTGFRSIAVIDSRTSQICRSLDNVVMKKTNSKWSEFVTPRHQNCRSMLVPEVNGKYKYDDSEAKRPTNFTVGDKKQPKRVSSRKSYYDELEKLSARDQDAILGKKLGKAFRKMDNADQFARETINQASLKPLTLKQMATKDNELGRILSNLD